MTCQRLSSLRLRSLPAANKLIKLIKLTIVEIIDIITFYISISVVLWQEMMHSSNSRCVVSYKKGELLLIYQIL